MREPTNKDIVAILETITDNMVTKDYLDQRLKKFATKEDIARLERITGDLNDKFDHLREGLAKAVEA